MMTRIISLILFCTLLSSCLDPGKAKNPAKIVESMTLAMTKKNSSIPYSTFEDVKEMQTYILVDVREDYERAVSTIPGSISKKEFEQDKKKYIQHNVIVYCTIGVRSTEYAKTLLPEGFIISVLRGGVLGWAHAGKSFIDKDGKETNKVHVYSEAWNLLPESYEGIF
ncbi:MAG: rhodanese-like domain-containing protein [Deltaproteobacteria bacterium]|nr:MAG: rhodanese-like domain-containing protein [Deltaproteobacteria bacterium]